MAKMKMRGAKPSHPIEPPPVWTADKYCKFMKTQKSVSAHDCTSAYVALLIRCKLAWSSLFQAGRSSTSGVNRDSSQVSVETKHLRGNRPSSQAQ